MLFTGRDMERTGLYDVVVGGHVMRRALDLAVDG